MEKMRRYLGDVNLRFYENYALVNRHVVVVAGRTEGRAVVKHACPRDAPYARRDAWRRARQWTASRAARRTSGATSSLTTFYGLGDCKRSDSLFIVALNETGTQYRARATSPSCVEASFRDVVLKKIWESGSSSHGHKPEI